MTASLGRQSPILAALRGLLDLPGLRRGKPQEIHRVAEVDFAPVAGLERHALEGLDGLADEERAALGVERAVSAEKHVLDAEEVEAAADGGRRSVHRSVAVEHAKVIERP